MGAAYGLKRNADTMNWRPTIHRRHLQLRRIPTLVGDKTGMAQLETRGSTFLPPVFGHYCQVQTDRGGHTLFNATVGDLQSIEKLAITQLHPIPVRCKPTRGLVWSTHPETIPQLCGSLFEPVLQLLSGHNLSVDPRTFES